MAAKFTAGDSLHTTRVVTKPAVNPSSNTMKGMKGAVKTSATSSHSILKGKGGAGPKREGPIGHKGRMESMRGRAKTSWE